MATAVAAMANPIQQGLKHSLKDQPYYIWSRNG